MRAMDCLPLLLDGMATSTKFNGESASQRAMVGMFMYDDSIRHWLSVLGSQTMTSLGSKNLYIKYKISNCKDSGNINSERVCNLSITRRALLTRNLLLGVLIGEGTWGPLSTEVVTLSVGCELKDGSLGVLSV